MSIGRDPSSTLCVNDLSVSRKHCTIDLGDAGVHEIADLDSHNGTFVNGMPISRRALQHGDRIRLGVCELIFLTGADDGIEPRPSRFSSQGPKSELKTVLVPEPSWLPKDATELGRMATDLAALFKINTVISSIHEMDRLQHELLERISEVIPADQGAIVLMPRLDEEPTSVCTWSRKSRRAIEMQIRNELVHEAVWSRAAVLSTAGTASAEGENVLCVPMVAVEKTLGVIYLSSDQRATAFGESHAYFLSSVAQIAAVALENILTLDSLRAENRRLKADVGASPNLVGKASRFAGSWSSSRALPIAIQPS